MTAPFDICIVGQAGRLSYEAVLFAASLRSAAPNFSGRLIVGEPNPGPLWDTDPRIDSPARAFLETLDCTFVSFPTHHFGQSYPQGNKVEMLAALKPDRPFVFFDTDTLITGPIDQIDFDFHRPSASMARENTWPKVPLYGPSLRDVWQAVYDRASVDIEPTRDRTHAPDFWEHYLYFNAGWFFYHCPQTFAGEMVSLMTNLKDDPPAELASQSLFPWLDQIALPAVIAKLGGGRPGPELSGLDGDKSLHWRALPLLYAKAPDKTLDFFETLTAPNKIKKVLKNYDPFKRIIYQGRGRKIREMFDRTHLPAKEQMLRNRIKRAGLWMR